MRVRQIFLFALFLAVAGNSFASADSGGGDGAAAYVAIKPAFVLNVNDGEEVHHLQLSVSFIPTDPQMGALITEHEPVIRNAIVVLVSGRQIREINSAQGKKKLREEIQDAVNKVMEESVGKAAVSRTLFTGFLIQ